MGAAEGDEPVRDCAKDSGNIRVEDSFGVLVGDHGTQHNHFNGPGRVAGTAYLEQVRDIGTAELRDRKRELQELADFCLGDEPCIWWQAGPWAGKSALMSWFVLHPPQNVDVICFFVTGRLAAQADSTAFTEAVLEQVASLTGERLPASLAPTARDAHRRQLLREAARRADQNGRRLVLVIDGLDEDRSRGPERASGAGMPSIASLLPRHPVEGLRVIVSGRPDPEIPDDVPDDHPLRHCAVRPLAPSVHARDIERVAKEELRRLLNGGEAARSVLGLVAAAQGGLTGSDLQAITNPFQQARTLALLTETLIWNADVQSARRVAAATCTVGSWTTAARPVLLLTADSDRQLTFGSPMPRPATPSHQTRAAGAAEPPTITQSEEGFQGVPLGGSGD